MAGKEIKKALDFTNCDFNYELIKNICDESYQLVHNDVKKDFEDKNKNKKDAN